MDPCLSTLTCTVFLSLPPLLTDCTHSVNKLPVVVVVDVCYVPSWCCFETGFHYVTLTRLELAL